MPPSAWRHGTSTNHKTVAETHESRWKPVYKHKPQSYLSLKDVVPEIWNCFRCDTVTRTFELLGRCQRASAKHGIASMAIQLRLCEQLHLIFQRQSKIRSWQHVHNNIGWQRSKLPHLCSYPHASMEEITRPVPQVYDALSCSFMDK